VLESGTTNVLDPNESQIFPVPIQVDGGAIVFETTGTGGLYARAEIDDCLKPVELVVEGVCLTETGEVVFTMTNLGQAMATGVPYTIYTASIGLQSGITYALGNGESQQFVVDARPGGATIYFMADGMLVPAETADCVALPRVIFDAQCSVDGVATFNITNLGGPMPDAQPYEIVDANGAVISSGTYQLGAGESVTLTVTGYYGQLSFNRPGARSVTTYCAPPPPPPPPQPPPPPPPPPPKPELDPGATEDEEMVPESEPPIAAAKPAAPALLNEVPEYQTGEYPLPSTLDFDSMSLNLSAHAFSTSSAIA